MKDARSPKQLAQRGKFALAIAFLKPMKFRLILALITRRWWCRRVVSSCLWTFSCWITRVRSHCRGATTAELATLRILTSRCRWFTMPTSVLPSTTWFRRAEAMRAWVFLILLLPDTEKPSFISQWMSSPPTDFFWGKICYSLSIYNFDF